MNEPITFIDHQGQEAILLQTTDGAQATILLHGAQLISWKPAGGGEQLYLSSTANFKSGHSVRGGVPVVFPQFELKGPDRSLPRHGFVRNRLWQLDSQSHSDQHTQVTLKVVDTEETRAIWPHGFALELTASIGANRLDIELYVNNTGTTAWPFAAALHTYLGISELEKIRLDGLIGHTYTDYVLGGEALEDHPEKRFYGEFDRIYEKVGSLVLRDGSRRVELHSDNLPDAVVWNPGPEKCAALPDMPDADWQRMICIEAARIVQPKTLSPGEEWTGRQTLIHSTE